MAFFFQLLKKEQNSNHPAALFDPPPPPNFLLVFFRDLLVRTLSNSGCFSNSSVSLAPGSLIPQVLSSIRCFRCGLGRSERCDPIAPTDRFKRSSQLYRPPRPLSQAPLSSFSGGSPFPDRTDTQA